MGITSRRTVAGIGRLKKRVRDAGSSGTPDVLKEALDLDGCPEIHTNMGQGVLEIAKLPERCTVMLLQGSFYLNDVPNYSFTETYTLMELDAGSTTLQLMDKSIVVIILPSDEG